MFVFNELIRCLYFVGRASWAKPMSTRFEFFVSRELLLEQYYSILRIPNESDWEEHMFSDLPQIARYSWRRAEADAIYSCGRLPLNRTPKRRLRLLAAAAAMATAARKREAQEVPSRYPATVGDRLASSNGTAANAHRTISQRLREELSK